MTEPRVALVTGASRGIGRAIARRLAAGGFHVLVNYRTSAAEAASVVQEILAEGGRAEALQADVTDPEQTRRMIGEIRRRHRRLDVLVNNAGRREDGFLLLMPAERWWRTFQDNVAAVVNCTRAALPLILAARPGAIVNISSLSGVRGTEGQTAYSAAKASVIGFTKALARELAPKRVAVNCVAPGPIQTEMYEMGSLEVQQKRVAMLPLGRIGCPGEVAEVVALLVEGKAEFVHGQVIAVDGGGSI